PLTCLFIHLFFFSFTIPRLPSSTLFPYTTLFRSGLGWRNVLRHRRVSVFLILTTALLVAVPFAIGTVAATATFSTEEVASTAMGDRKSTRLNSSHVSISYAVSCLKKKNNKYMRTI